jgi:hypothetical protein
MMPTLFPNIARKGILLTILPAVLLSAGVSANGPSEGIHVRGDWVISIRSAEGVLLREHTFSNALEAGGAGYLTSLLKFGADVIATREDGGLPWSVNIGDSSAPDPLPGAVGVDLNDADCVGVLRSTPPLQASDPNYPDINTEEDNGVDYLVLRRSLAVPPECLTDASWSITSVSTVVRFTFTNSNAGSSTRFTRKVLDQPIAGIMPNQTVDLTVRISFQ